jgi:hypothetical protein
MTPNVRDSLQLEALRQLTASVDSLRTAVAITRAPGELRVDVIHEPSRPWFEVSWPVILGALIALLSSLAIERWREHRKNSAARRRIRMRLAHDLASLQHIKKHGVIKDFNTPVPPHVLRDFRRIEQGYYANRNDLFAIRTGELREKLARWYLLTINRSGQARRRELGFQGRGGMKPVQEPGYYEFWREFFYKEIDQMYEEGLWLLKWARRESRKPKEPPMSKDIKIVLGEGEGEGPVMGAPS